MAEKPHPTTGIGTTVARRAAAIVWAARLPPTFRPNLGITPAEFLARARYDTLFVSLSGWALAFGEVHTA